MLAAGVAEPIGSGPSGDSGKSLMAAACNDLG